jgi:saccharopine dehydrogenase-like NADP-dependent oxidoreductase
MKILILGIGRSTYFLLEYLNHLAGEQKIHAIAIDVQQELIEKRKAEFSRINFIQSQIDKHLIDTYVANADLVISMLPPAFHTTVAELCLQKGKHFFTASYVSAEIKAMHAEVEKKGLLFMMECGLDPGIDHMSALALIHSLKGQGAEITSFESFTGGLVHPDFLNPPWNYKVSWNPRNVVLAGQGTPAQYKEAGEIKYLPYQQLFTQPSAWQISAADVYEGYPNRDSLSYQSLYVLERTKTFIRGTLRYPGYCRGWNYLVQLGMTDDSKVLHEDSARTGRSFLANFLPVSEGDIEQSIQKTFGVDALPYFRALGLFDHEPISPAAATAAQILQSIIEKKWKLQQDDKDRIVMIHRLRYLLNGKEHIIQSSLLVDGDDAERTAMAKTVGLPLAIAVDLFLQGSIHSRGVQIPLTPEFYKPILKKLKTFGIVFNESDVV